MSEKELSAYNEGSELCYITVNAIGKLMKFLTFIEGYCSSEGTSWNLSPTGVLTIRT